MTAALELLLRVRLAVAIGVAVVVLFAAGLHTSAADSASAAGRVGEGIAFSAVMVGFVISLIPCTLLGLAIARAAPPARALRAATVCAGLSALAVLIMPWPLVAFAVAALVYDLGLTALSAAATRAVSWPGTRGGER